MADQLFLSYKFRDWTSSRMLRSYEKLLRKFPFSRLSTASSALRIQAVSEVEPDLVEVSLPTPVDVDIALATLRDYIAPDLGAILETQWDLWQYDKEWKLMPARLSLLCFGPEFESEREDDLRIEFGIDTHFLPQIDLPNFLFMAQSNIRSLMQLVRELDENFAAESRSLWTDSGENFAGMIQAALVGYDGLDRVQ